MKDRDNLSTALATATCALLGTAITPRAAASEADKWSLDTALLYYGESDDRVRDISAVIDAERDFGDERTLGLKLTADTLTGASPSGAIALDQPQTFTSPSGRATYTTPAGQVPLDDSFLDTRFALDASWSQPFAEYYALSAGIGFSSEYDYTHIGGNFSVARDFNKRNTTISAGVAYASDDIDPVGGAPIPLSRMLDVGDNANKAGTDSKQVLDFLVGLTQVLDRSTVLRVNYSYSDSSGYLTDPYKFLSVVDPVTGDTIPNSPAPGAEGPSGVFLFESRPDSRVKQSAHAEVKHAFGASVLRVAYRYATDDWGIDSNTIEAAYRWPIGNASFIEPLVRYYDQTEADFYRFSLSDGEPLPSHASADYRLGNFDAVTVGIKFGQRLRNGNEWSARAEYYQQNGKVPSGQIIGLQADRDQFPDLTAIIIRVGYRFKL